MEFRLTPGKGSLYCFRYRRDQITPTGTDTFPERWRAEIVHAGWQACINT